MSEKIVFGLRHMGQMLTPTAVCLAETYGYMALRYAAEDLFDMSICAVGGSILPDSSEAIVKSAIERDADWIFWIDSDMTFPATALETLLYAAKASQSPIVGANYAQRRRPAKPTAQAPDGSWIYLEDCEPDEHGLVDAAFMGMGVLLTHVDVFRNTPEPWFAFTWSEKDCRWGGEDVWMMKQVFDKLGYRPKVHVELSKKIGHVGQHIYTWQDSTADRERENEPCRDGTLPHQRAMEAAE
jgi:hypothetical protein